MVHPPEPLTARSVFRFPPDASRRQSYNTTFARKATGRNLAVYVNFRRDSPLVQCSTQFQIVYCDNSFFTGNLKTVKPCRIVREDSLGQLRRTDRSHKLVDQRFVAKTTIRRKDGATHMLVVRRSVRPVAAPHAAIRRNLQNGCNPCRISSDCKRVRARVGPVWYLHRARSDRSPPVRVSPATATHFPTAALSAR